MNNMVDPAPYNKSENGYNRESGKKTLMFVGTIIVIIIILTVLSLFMIIRKSSVLIQSKTFEKSKQIETKPINKLSPVAPYTGS